MGRTSAECGSGCWDPDLEKGVGRHNQLKILSDRRVTGIMFTCRLAVERKVTPPLQKRQFWWALTRAGPSR